MMNQQQRQTMRELAAFLMEIPEEKFDIGQFTSSKTEYIYDNFNSDWYWNKLADVNVCGTSACALGWLPAMLGKDEMDRLVCEQGSLGLSYWELGRVVFGIKSESLLWNLCFSGDHSDYASGTNRNTARRLEIVSYLSDETLELLNEVDDCQVDVNMLLDRIHNTPTSSLKIVEAFIREAHEVKANELD